MSFVIAEHCCKGTQEMCPKKWRKPKKCGKVIPYCVEMDRGEIWEEWKGEWGQRQSQTKVILRQEWWLKCSRGRERKEIGAEDKKKIKMPQPRGGEERRADEMEKNDLLIFKIGQRVWVAHQKVAWHEWGGTGFRWSEMMKERRSWWGREKKKMKGRWMCCTGVLVAAERGWWLTQAYKELRAAEADWMGGNNLDRITASRRRGGL